METIRKIYKIGQGPSSSHTMGPRKAALLFRNKYPESSMIRATFYGSLAATGKGHMTDVAVTGALSPIPVELVWHPEIFLPFHPNGMKFEAIGADGVSLGNWTVYSIGGGDIAEENQSVDKSPVYSLDKMKDILNWCSGEGRTLWEFVETHEDSSLWTHLEEVWGVMKEAVERGIDMEGCLQGGLNLQRRAASYHVKASGYTHSIRNKSLVFSYALAVSEENADGGRIVTAPTCGSCGVVPAVLYHLHKNHDFSDKKILKALATAGLIGNLVKVNASISGADVGCQ
ncbi:MAG: L-serine ammonia-lyase, iron-sulfur-dependent, subunit alpha, partial [Bacteroidetes bacterium]|nr:L-serine ammonia-lyase, iron-sulfur-dependent, subunit alpha [Bacteroidota bacterium]